MNSFFCKIEKSTSAGLLTAYVLLTLVVAFHYHSVDFEAATYVKFNDSKNSANSNVTYNKCLFIHHAANVVQFFEDDSEHSSNLQLFTLINSFGVNSFPFKEQHLLYLRAPPKFS